MSNESSSKARENPFSLGATSEEIISDLREQLADANAGYASQMRQIAALQAENEGLRAFVTDYIAAEEAAIEQWKKDYPRLPWKPDHEAMKRLARARAALKAAKGEA